MSRRTRARLGPTVLLTLGVLSLGPSSAFGGAGFVDTFTLRAAHGFELTVRAARNGSDTSATISLTRDGSGSFSAVRYRVVHPRIVTRKRISADFGPFGTVRVKFDPDGGGVHGACRDFVSGDFRGTVRFNGEAELAPVGAKRAKGRVAAVLRRPCIPGLGPARKGAARSKITTLVACRPAQQVFYLVLEGLFDDGPFHFAGVSERIGTVEVEREVGTAGTTGSFVTRRHLQSATVRPPGRFNGSAEYGSNHLDGDLSADFPGEPSVPLVPALARVSTTGGTPRACEPALGLIGRQQPRHLEVTAAESSLPPG